MGIVQEDIISNGPALNSIFINKIPKFTIFFLLHSKYFCVLGINFVHFFCHSFFPHCFLLFTVHGHFGVRSFLAWILGIIYFLLIFLLIFLFIFLLIFLFIFLLIFVLIAPCRNWVFQFTFSISWWIYDTLTVDINNNILHTFITDQIKATPFLVIFFIFRKFVLLHYLDSFKFFIHIIF